MPGELLAEKSQEQAGGGDGESETPAKEAPAASKPMVGIIYPPPEVRSIPPITFFSLAWYEKEVYQIRKWLLFFERQTCVAYF